MRTLIHVLEAAFVVLGVFAGLVALFAAGTYWSDDAKIRRELRSTRLYRIADLADGVRGRIVGRAYPLMEPLRAPMTGRPCVYFHVAIERRLKNGKAFEWRALATEKGGTSFGVRDDSGRAIVEIDAARMALDLDAERTSGQFDDLSPGEAEVLARHHINSAGFGEWLRYREVVIGIDKPLAILGSGVREPDPDAPPADAYRGDPPTRLLLTSSPAFPLVISDSRETLQS